MLEIDGAVGLCTERIVGPGIDASSIVIQDGVNLQRGIIIQYWPIIARRQGPKGTHRRTSKSNSRKGNWMEGGGVEHGL